MYRRPPSLNRPDHPFPDTTLFRSDEPRLAPVLLMAPQDRLRRLARKRRGRARLVGGAGIVAVHGAPALDLAPQFVGQRVGSPMQAGKTQSVVSEKIGRAHV